MRRRGRSPTCHMGTNANTEEYLDKDDQDALVESLEVEALAQNRQFQTYFGIVGGFAALISLIYPLLCQQECSSQWFTCWFHALVSLFAHLGAIYLSRTDPSSLRAQQPLAVVALTTVVIVIPILLWIMGFFSEDIEHFHIGLTIGNLVTFVGTMLLRWDVYSTTKALEDLHGAKYEHKSL